MRRAAQASREAKPPALAALLDVRTCPEIPSISSLGAAPPTASAPCATSPIRCEGVSRRRKRAARTSGTSRSSPPRRRPTRAELQAARNKTIHDCLGPGLDVIFVGINPSLYSAAVGHHFARPGNRFWPALHRAGFTPREFSPFEDCDLLEYGCGLTNLVPRATARADELTRDELVAGARALEAKVRRLRPRCVAIVGVTAYRTAFGRAHARLGPQPETLAGATLWVLPNPSGLNAHYQLPALVNLFSALHKSLRTPRRTPNRK